MSPTEKPCPRCKEVKLAAAFGRDTSTTTGLTSYCLACRKAAKADWDHANPGASAEYHRQRRATHGDEIREKALAKYHAMTPAQREQWKAKQRAHHLRRQYGMSVEELDLLIAMHDNGCAICGTKFNGAPRGPGAMAIDHDHATDRVRGLLCAGCNAGIGYLQDRPDLLLRAADYLRRQQAGRLRVA